MNIDTVEAKLSECGLKLKQLYHYCMPDFSILHQEACKEFLDRDVTHHEFYCDMKRLESLEIGGVCVGLYDHQAAGFPTEINVTPECLDYALNLIKNVYVEHVLVFERIGTDPKPYPVPVGKVYKIVRK